MILSPRFFYDDNAGETGGNVGGEAATATNTATDVVIPEDIQKELSELRAFKQSIAEREPEKTPEQIAKEVELEKVNFRKFAVERELMKDDDFTRFDTISKKQERDLVFERFANEQKEDNPEITDDEIKEAFDDEYKLNSENEKVKARGMARLQKEASEIKNPLESAYKNAKSNYDEERSIEKQVAPYKKFIDELIVENTPEKLTLYKTKDGEEEITVDVELSKADREELAKTFINPKTFRAFLDSNGKLDDIKPKLAQKINGFLKQKYFETALSKSFETGHGRGVLKGSSVGANNPFALTKGGGQSQETIKNADQEIAESQTNVRKKMLGGY